MPAESIKKVEKNMKEMQKMAAFPCVSIVVFAFLRSLTSISDAREMKKQK